MRGLVLVLLFVIGCASPSPMVRFFEDEKDLESNCGYRNPDDVEKGIPCPYLTCFTDTLYNYAVVADTNYHFIGVNRKGEFIYKVYPFDNGPDYISEGFFRIIENGKIGFANGQTGKIEIPPKFDFAFPFSEGYSAYCVGCKKVKSDYGGHTSMKGGLWGYLDKKGRKAVPAKYTKAYSFQRDSALVFIGEKKSYLKKEDLH